MDSRSAKTVAAVGLLYPLLTVVGFVAFPKPPGGDVSAAHDPDWLATNTNAVIAQSYVRALAAIGFIALTAAIAHTARRATLSPSLTGLITAGGATCGALLLAAQTTTLAAALASRDHLPSGVIRPFDNVNAALLAMSSLPAVLLFAGAGVMFWQRVKTPRWLAVLTLAGVPLSLVDALSYEGGPLAAVGILGLAFFLVWSLSAAVYLSWHHVPNDPTVSSTVRDEPAMVVPSAHS
ncbi:MAG: hypothetical protein ACR2KL_05195 [Nocardioidaceae bacterium]